LADRALMCCKKDLKASGGIAASCEWRQSKYLNNLVEQDHRPIQSRHIGAISRLDFDAYLRHFLPLTHISPFWRIYVSNDTSSRGSTSPCSKIELSS
jgi:transposase-like protein